MKEKLKLKMKFSEMTLALVRILSVCLLLAGSFIIFVGGEIAYEAYSSQKWPTTKGEIIQSYVYAYSDSCGNRTYLSKIKYAYSPNQSQDSTEQYIGDRIAIDPIPTSNDRSKAEIKLTNYPKGAKVNVFYNPYRPEKSLLEPGFSFSKLIYLGVGGLCLIVSIILWLFGKQRFRV